MSFSSVPYILMAFSISDVSISKEWDASAVRGILLCDIEKMESKTKTRFYKVISLY
jgi:hypothetical protein